MKKTLFSVFMLVVIILVVTNIFGGTPDCAYSNYNGSFTFSERNIKGRGFRMCQNRFLNYKKDNSGDTFLYRICPKNPLQFWNYSDYLFSDQFRLPYMNWKEIDSRRGAIENKTGF